MIDYSRLPFGKGLPRLVLKMIKATAANSQERKVRREVYARDGAICFFPGCRRRPVDLAHLKARSLGGLFVPQNLVRACRQHHQWWHAGLIRVSGRPKHLKVKITGLGQQAGIHVPKRKIA